MATDAALDGGAGGKFRKRPPRRALATPYDRPPATARIGLRGALGEGERNGWLARLVDPASRLITSGATRFFSSVFRKRLAPPPPPPPPPQEVDIEHKEEMHGTTSIKPPMLKIHDQGHEVGQTFKGNSNSGGDGMSELEQLLNHKTFTRVELDRLTELLRSRTVGLSVDGEDQKIEASTSQPAIIPGKEENTGVLEKDNEIWTSKFFGSTPKPYSSSNLSSGAVRESEEGIASPTELAKAYMCSRSSKPGLPSSMYSVSRREPTTSSSPQFLRKPSDMSVGPRSSIRFAGHLENGSRNPRSQGRSALYKMSRSPYFKAQTMSSDKGREIFDVGSDGSTRSQLVQSDLSLSIGKQALKHRSSVLDSDLGSIGPIRRIRHKSNLASSSKELISSSSERYYSTLANGLKGAAASVQKPSVSDSAKYYNVLEDADNRDGILSFVPHQSSQMAGKILQLVDQLVPSPKTKTSELKAGTVEESPPKSTSNMRNKQTLKSVEDIDSVKSFSVQGNGKMDGSSGSFSFKGPVAFPSPILDKVEKNGPIRSASSGMKAVLEVNGMDRVTTTISNSNYGLPMGSPAVLVPDVVSLQKKPAFKMQVPESSLELDTDDQGVKEAFSNAVMEKENLKLSMEKSKLTSEVTFQKINFVYPSDGKLDSDMMPSKEDAKKMQVKVTRKDNGFTFPVAPSESSSQAPPTPSMLATFSEQSVPPKEELVPPVFSFSSKSAPSLSFSSTATSTSDSSGPKFGILPNSKSEVSVSAAASTLTTQKELPSLTNASETDKVNETSKPVGGLFSGISSSMVPPVFAFGASSSTSLSNGSLKTTPCALAVSAASTSEPSENLLGSVVSSSSAFPPAWISTTTSASTKIPSFPAIPAPTIVTTRSVAVTDVATARTESKNFDSKPFKAPTFGINDISSVASAIFSSSGSSNIFSFGSTAPSPSLGSTSGQLFGTSGQLFGLQPSQSATATAVSGLTAGSTFSSSAPASTAVAGSSLFPFGGSGFGSSTSADGSFSFGPSSGSAQSSPMFTTNASASGSSGGVSFASPATTSSLFGSSSGSSFASIVPGTSLFSSSSSSSFPTPATSSSLFSSTTSQASSSIFGFGSSTSSQSTPSIFGAGASPTVFSFGQSTAASATNPIAFSASSSSPFSFTVAAAATTSMPIFGAQTAINFGSSSPGNDQMNVEDSMTEDTTQPAMPVTPVFGQAANPPMASNLTFGSSSLQPSGFQFGSQPSTAFPQAQSPFQAPGNLEFAAGGSFSLGSAGGDKSGRRIVKVKRDKLRKK